MSDEEYRRAMETLALETTMPPATAARIERQLLDALASHDSADVVPSPRMKGVDWRPHSGGTRITVGWRTWLPAAAAVVLVAGVAFVWRLNRPMVTQDYSRAPRPVAETPAAPVVDETVTMPLVESRTASVAHAPHRTRAAQQKANVVTPSGFVDLPWTTGLPAFESGEIVRVDVPVASLPAYGIDISSGAGDRPVEADLLIGQDGLARAIRLVKSTTRSTQ
jgi:hypothetical protein